MTSPTSPAQRPTGTDKLLAEVSGKVAMVTINNPQKRNALSREIRAALPGVLAALVPGPGDHEHADVRVAIQRRKHARQCLADLARQRVPLLRVVDRHQGDLVGHLNKQLVGARRTPCGRSR